MIASSSTGLWVCHQIHIRLSFGMYKHQSGKMPQILVHLGIRDTRNDRYMAIVIRENGMVKTYLAFTDNLGNILSVMDENGAKVFDSSYDAWGSQTVTISTIGLYRGYTGHRR